MTTEDLARKLGLADSGPDAPFDRMTHLAVRALGAPASALSFVEGDSLVIASSRGLDAGLAPVAGSPCQAVIDRGEPLAVEDARDRSAFRSHPLVAEAGFVAFLCHPVEVDGEPVGSLCVLDPEPRSWTDGDEEALRSLGVTVSDEIELGQSRKAAEHKIAEADAAIREIAEHITDVVWMTTDDKEELLHFNDAFEDVWERDPSELLEDPLLWLRTIHPEDRDRIQEALPEQVEGNYDEHYRILTPDGEVKWIHDRAFPVTDASGEITGRIVGVARDVTELKSREVELERRHRALFESSIVPVVVVDPESGEVEATNAAARERFGYSEEEVEELNVAELHPPEARDRARELLEEGREVGEVRFTEAFVTREGERFIGEVHATRVRLPDQELLYGTLRDVTERVELERWLREQTRRLREAQRVAEIGSWEWRPDEDEVHWSKELYRIFDRDLEDFEPTYEGFLEQVHPEDRDRMDRIVRNAWERAEPFDTDYRGLRPDGSVRRMRARGRIETDEGGEPVRMVGTCHNITERRNLAHRYRELFESNVAGVVVSTTKGTIWKANRSAAEILGASSPEELEGSSVADFYRTPADREQLRSMARDKGGVRNYELEAQRVDGTPVDLLMNLRILDREEREDTIWLTSFLDVTERSRLQSGTDR